MQVTSTVVAAELTQTDTAKLIATSGHRMPQGRTRQQATVSALISGR